MRKLLELWKKLQLLPAEQLRYCPFHQRIHQANYRNPIKKTNLIVKAHTKSKKATGLRLTSILNKDPKLH